MTITAHYFHRSNPMRSALSRPSSAIELQPLGRCKSDCDLAIQERSSSGRTTMPMEDWLRSKRKYDELQKKTQILPCACPAQYLNRKQALALLTTIRNAIHNEAEAGSNNPSVDSTLRPLIDTLARWPSEHLTLELWAGMSLTLEHLLAQPLQNHIRQNLRYLEQVSRNSWAQLAHDHLVAYFAREIERVAVDNPAMQDTSSLRVGLELTTPLTLLSAGAELRVQSSKAIDDEGNYVISRQVSGSMTCNLKALFAGMKGKLTGSAESYAYGRTAQDYARHMFVQLVADNKKLPVLARYLSRVASTGQIGTQLDEISDFEQANNIYLLQQNAISRSFSVLLSLSATRPESSEHEPVLMAPRIALQAVAAPKARMTQGTTSGTTVGGQGSVGASVLQAGIKVESTSKNVSTGREATLCELLKNPYTSRAFNAAMQRDIVNACAKIRHTVQAFWDGESTRANAQQRQAQFIAHYTQDWHHYQHLHAMQGQGHATTAACIAAFHQKYGVRNTRECLCAMALLLADYYVRLLDQPGTAECGQMKSAVQKLEQELHESSIPDARQMLAQHAMARQRIDYASNEKTVQFSVGCNPQPDSGNSSVKITSRTLHHYNALRSGDEVTVELTIGDAVEQNRQLLKAIRNYFKDDVTGLHVNFGIDTFSRQGVVIVRYFKPKIFVGLPFVKLFERRVVQTNRQFSATATVPLGGPVGVRASLGYAQSSSQLVSETPGSDTLLYFARHYLHALAAGKADNSARAVQDSCWYRMERQQSRTLEKLLVNLASHSRKKTGLNLELDVIGRALLRSRSEREKYQISRQKMQNLARRLEQYRSAENYQAALAGFKEFMTTVLPYWPEDYPHLCAI